MIMECVYKQENMCLAKGESIECVVNTYGWKCGIECEWSRPGASGKDKDRILIEEYHRLKKYNTDDIFYNSLLAGHDAFNEYDYANIEYEAGMLALFMNKKWKYLSEYAFCYAAKQAKRLGFRVPTNTDKALRRKAAKNEKIVKRAI